MAYKLTNYERETIINYNEQEITADVFTYNAALIRKLSAPCETRSDEIQQTDTNSYGGVTYTVPKSWIKINPPKKMNYTNEQRQEMAARMAEINNKRF